jgi:hypothetical protein
MDEAQCKLVAWKVKMAFMPDSFAGGVFMITKNGFVKDWMQTNVSQAVWDAKWRQLKSICEYIENIPENQRRAEALLAFLSDRH